MAKKEVKKEETNPPAGGPEKIVETLKEDSPAGEPEEKEIDQARDYLNSWKRCQADFENYRKMQSENSKQLIGFATENIILQMLPILDNFHASTDHIPEDQKNNPWVVGIMHIQKQLETFLKDNGVEEIETKTGDKFDPEIHEAVHQEELRIKNQESGKIVKIVSKGYKIGNKVIRAARVIVN